MLTEIEHLPQPDSAALSHSKKVEKFIVEKIGANGPISFHDFMAMALYAPGLGYYSAGALKIGQQGDFVTAPEISPLFSICLAKQCKEVMDLIGQIDILEIGAGSGVMAADILLYLEQQKALPTTYIILEVSADLKERQEKNLKEKIPHLISIVKWISVLPEKKLNAAIIANEVLDAMPVHLFKIEEDYQEYFVDYHQHKFEWITQKMQNQTLRQAIDELGQLPENYQSEINLALPGWIKSLSQILEKGLILLIDYGFSRREYYHPDRSRGTLMCHYRHHAHMNPLIFVGIQDMTAHVDFTAIAESAERADLVVNGYTTQAHFLLSLGITDLIKENMNDLSLYFSQTQQIKKLLLPSEMGELFKVMGLTKGMQGKDFTGFKLNNMKEKL